MRELLGVQNEQESQLEDVGGIHNEYDETNYLLEDESGRTVRVGIKQCP